MIAYGPVPSRRLGRSLGINNIPPKNCSYSCVYCQIGRTSKMGVERQAFYAPVDVFKDVEERVEGVRKDGEAIDFLTFVPDGEPTLDINLGREIELLRGTKIKIGVISNASIIWKDDVQEDLSKADWVSLKLDTADEETWRRINRPHRSLDLDDIMTGIMDFKKAFKGELVTETMLVRGVNDNEDDLGHLAGFLKDLRPGKSYISIPTRPPAEDWVKPPAEDTLNLAYQRFVENGIEAEMLIGYEGDAFASTGDVENDLLSITSVHPMRESAVRELLDRNGADWNIVVEMIKGDRLVELEYGKDLFYLRRLPSQHGECRKT